MNEQQQYDAQITLRISGQKPNNELAPFLMRIVFAHISNHILLKGVVIKGDVGARIAIINYSVQAGFLDAPESLMKEIEDAVRLRGELTLVSQTRPPQFVEIPAILADVNNGHRYVVQPAFAAHAAINDACRQEKQLLAPNIISVNLRCQVVNTGRVYTGVISTCTGGKNSFVDKPNPYHCFATALNAQPELCDLLRNENRDVESVRMLLMPGKPIVIEVSRVKKFEVNLPLANNPEPIPAATLPSVDDKESLPLPRPNP